MRVTPKRLGLPLLLAVVLLWTLIIADATVVHAAVSSGAYVVSGSNLLGEYTEAHWLTTFGDDAISPGDPLTFSYRFEEFSEHVVSAAGSCPSSEAFDPHSTPLSAVDLARAWSPITYPFEAPFGATSVSLTEGTEDEDNFTTVEACDQLGTSYVATVRLWDVREGGGTISGPSGTQLLGPDCYYIAPKPPSVDPFQPFSASGTFASVSIGGAPCPSQSGTGTVRILKEVVNDDGGSKTAGQFSFSVDGGVDVAFDEAGDADGDPLTGQNFVAVDPGAHFVTEAAVHGYQTTYDNCSDIQVSNGEVETCTITNDDSARQASIEINSLSIAATRSGATGEFNITDESSITSAPDGFQVHLLGYGTRWEFKRKDKKATFVPVANISCTYGVESLDGLPGSPGYASGDPITFDETVSISYTCSFGDQLSEHGTLRGTAFALIADRPDKEFSFTASVAL